MKQQRATSAPTEASETPAGATAPRSGKGASSASRSSVMEMRYGHGDPLTIGGEGGDKLRAAETFALVSSIEKVLAAVAGTPIESRVHPELMESTVEVATGVCRNIDDARRDLTSLRRDLAKTIRPLGLRIGSAGTHPFSLAEDQRI